MTDRFLSMLNKLANWKVIAVVAVLFVVFDLVFLPLLTTPAGESVPVLDVRFWYTPQQAEEGIAQYSAEARRASIIGHLTIDLVFPVIYSLLLSLLLIVVFRRTAPEHLRQVSLFPWRAALADIFENLGLVAMFSLHPVHFPLLSWITTIFTALKWLQLGFSLLVLVIGIILLFIKRSESSV